MKRISDEGNDATEELNEEQDIPVQEMRIYLHNIDQFLDATDFHDENGQIIYQISF